MGVFDFTESWTVESDGRPAAPVVLPHDVMVFERRDRKARNGANTGWFPGGRYTYRKTFAAAPGVAGPGGSPCSSRALTTAAP